MITEQLTAFKQQTAILEKQSGFSGLHLIITEGSRRRIKTGKALLTIPVQNESAFLSYFYLETNGVAFKWEINTEEQRFGGSLNIPSLEVLLGGFGSKEAIYKANCFKEFFINDEVTENPVAKDLHVFDMDKFENYTVGIDLINHKLYLNLNYMLYPIHIELDDYIECCIQSFGLSFWQCQYVISDDIAVVSRRDSFMERANTLGIKTLYNPKRMINET